MKNLKIERNKSTTYLLPIFANYVHISYFRLLKNTYLWIDDITEDTFCLLYRFDGKVVGEQESRQGFTVYEEKNLRRSPYYLDSEDFGEYVIFQFKLPEEMMKVKAQFIAGKFSHYTDIHKNIILSFILRYYGVNERDAINKVFTKDENLRNELIDELGKGVILPKNAELTSSPYIEKETFINSIEIPQKGEEDEITTVL